MNIYKTRAGKILNAARREYFAEKMAEAEMRGDTTQAKIYELKYKILLVKDQRKNKEDRATEERIVL